MHNWCITSFYGRAIAKNSEFKMTIPPTRLIRPSFAPTLSHCARFAYIISRPNPEDPMDDQTRTELEAAAFRALRDHLATSTDVQNIDLMNLAGFCRNCLSRWYQEAANAKGIDMDKAQAREIFYGMPFDEWTAKHQTEASPEAKAAFSQNH